MKTYASARNIKITSKLTTTQQRTLRAAANFYHETNNVWPTAFIHVGRSKYAPLHDVSIGGAHSTARHMMVVAGTTFDYELV